MYGLFYDCSSLESLNIDNFNVSLVTDMTGMFCNCQSLTELNLNNFNTINVKIMKSMFFGCYSLTSLDLSNFRTSNVENMYGMFFKCSSLTSLNLSNFDTSSVTDMSAMFRYCSKLKSLNLNNFKTTLVNSMYNMFDNCNSLTDLDFQSFNTTSVTTMFNMFSNCSSLTTLNLSNFDTSSLTNNTYMFNGCNNNLLYCIINKNNTIQNNLLPILISNSLNNNNCSQLCFYKNRKYIFEKEQCIINCYDDDIYKFEYENICYKSCPNGTQISTYDEYLCIKEKQETLTTTDSINKNDISSSSSFYISSYLEKVNDSIYIDINYFTNLCKIKDNVTTLDDIIRKIRNEINNHNLDQLINFFIEKQKEDLLANENDIKYQITSTYNQKNKKYNNISTINLGECETKIRLQHNICNDTTLLIFKIDIKEEGLLIPIIEYEVYNSETKEKLNLEICKDIKINISIPVNIDENNLFKYNLSSEYYNDICYPYTTEYKTDITLIFK